MMILIRRLLIFMAGVLLVLIGYLLFCWFYRPGVADYQQFLHAADEGQNIPGLRATWLGVSTVLLDDGEHALLIDPFLTRPQGWGRLMMDRSIRSDAQVIRQWLSHDVLDRLRAITAGHSHYDHVMDAGQIGLMSDAVLYGSASTLNVGRGAGMPESRLKLAVPGQHEHFGPYTVTYIQSVHGGVMRGEPTGDIDQPLAPDASYSDYRQGGSWSILVEHPLGSILHHGSAGYVPGALDGYEADVVLLGIALRSDLDEYLQNVVDAVGAQRVIPTHWDDFSKSLDEPMMPLPIGVDLDGFFEDIRSRPDLVVQTLPVGEPRLLFADPQP